MTAGRTAEPGPSPAPALLLVLAPLAMLAVFGLGRDVPPSTSCGDVATERSVVDAYRAGVWWFVAAGEGLAVVLLLLALRRTGRSVTLDLAIACVALFAGIGVATAVVSSNAAEGFGAGLAVGAAVALPVWWVLHAITGRRPTTRAVLLLLGVVVPVVVVVYLALLFAWFAPEFALPGLLVIGPGAVAWAATRRSWSALGGAAATFAVLVVPAAAALVLGRGDGPPFC